MIFITAIAFFLLLSVLIMIHEWGHYYAAIKSGVVVEEFGFGLPPKAKKLFTYKGTAFTLNWIPFGGFVRLKGESSMNLAEHRAPGSFGAASVLARITILCAGVFMNFVLAVALLTIGFSVGKWVPTYRTIADMEAAIASKQIEASLGIEINAIEGENNPNTDLPIGSIISHIDGVPVTTASQISSLQADKQTVIYTLLLAPDHKNSVQKEVTLQDGKAGLLLSVSVYNVVVPYRNPIHAFSLAMKESYTMVIQTIAGIGHLLTNVIFTGSVPKEISGIVGIAQLTHQSVQAGIMTYLKLVALLSLSLAVLNILPFPALDGGRLVFVFIEVLTGKPVNRELEVGINALGFFTLLLLIIIVTFHDIARLF